MTRFGLAALPDIDYDERARSVYWRHAPACHARGRRHADCLLEAGHDGPHLGNGYDDWGPLGPFIWSSRDRMVGAL